MFKDGDIVCFLGDSITASELWEAEVYQILRKKYRIKCYNCGVPGATATQAIEYLYSECLIYNPDYVVVMYGMNDLGFWLYNKESEKTEGIELQREELLRLHKENYEAIIKAIKDFGATPVICLPTPYDEVSDVQAEAIPYQRVLESAADFQLTVAEKYGCHVVNFKDNLKGFLGKRNIIREDRIHPTEEGYHIMAQVFLKETGEISDCDFDAPFEFEPWNKERLDIIADLQGLKFVKFCIGYSKNFKTQEIMEFIKEDCKKIKDKEGFTAKAYEAFMENNDMYNAIRGEIIKKTIF